jgi:hypothetical protein
MIRFDRIHQYNLENVINQEMHSEFNLKMIEFMQIELEQENETKRNETKQNKTLLLFIRD